MSSLFTIPSFSMFPSASCHLLLPSRPHYLLFPLSQLLRSPIFLALPHRPMIKDFLHFLVKLFPDRGIMGLLDHKPSPQKSTLVAFSLRLSHLFHLVLPLACYLRSALSLRSAYRFHTWYFSIDSNGINPYAHVLLWGIKKRRWNWNRVLCE